MNEGKGLLGRVAVSFSHRFGLQGRRRVLALLAVLGVGFVAPGVPGAQRLDAGAFLESLNQDAVAMLTDPSLDQT